MKAILFSISFFFLFFFLQKGEPLYLFLFIHSHVTDLWQHGSYGMIYLVYKLKFLIFHF